MKGWLPRSGIWRLVLLADKKPFETPRRNARVVKLLLPRLFPRANFSVWVDAHLALVMDPRTLVANFLEATGAHVAAIEHYKRRNMLEEKEQLLRDFPKNGTSFAVENRKSKHDQLLEQWDFYEAEQREQAGGGSGWYRDTVLPEGGLILARPNSPTAQLFHCNWFNEYTRFFERDLLPLSYTLKRMGLTPKPGCPNAFHLIDRKSHWYNTDIKEHDIAFRCGHRHDFKAGCKWLRLSWPV